MRSAAILAGGTATRFAGQDKGTLIVDGQTIRERQLAMLASVCDDLLIAGGTPVADGTTRYVEDIVPGAGPMGGIHAALAAARGDALFAIGCDMPYVSAALVAHLFELAGAADLVVPRTEDGYHPLCAVYTRACLAPLTDRLARRAVRMTGLLADVRVRSVGPDELSAFGDPRRLLANVNTPAEYAGLEALHGHKR